MVMFAKLGFEGGALFQFRLAETVKLPALPSPPKKLSCWQTTVPFGLMTRIEGPAVHVPVTRFCLLLTAVAVALKFAFTSAAVAGVPETKVLGTVRSAGHASGDARTNSAEAKQRPAERRVTL